MADPAKKRATKKTSPKTLGRKKTIKDIRAQKTVKALLENGGNRMSVSAAMRDAGYAEGYARNPNKFIERNQTQDLLELYFPDSLIYEKTHELMHAAEIEHFLFPAISVSKDKKNKEKTMMTNEEIKYIIEEVAGCKLIYIRDSDFPKGRLAFFQAPALKARKDGIELAAKLKGSFKADATNPADRNPFSKMTDEELAAQIKEAKDVLKKRV